jgi:predicted Fe-S protein YdhL (DUF1289 family)
MSDTPREILALDFTVERAKTLTPVGSPCTNVCRLDEASRTYCIGCHRSRAEIKAWKTLADDERGAIIETLLDRATQRSNESDKINDNHSASH